MRNFNCRDEREEFERGRFPFSECQCERFELARRDFEKRELLRRELERRQCERFETVRCDLRNRELSCERECGCINRAFENRARRCECGQLFI